MRVLPFQSTAEPLRSNSLAGCNLRRPYWARASKSNVDTVSASLRHTEQGDEPSTSSLHESSWWSRRRVSLSGAVLIAALASNDAADAAKTVTLRDGSQVQAFEHGMSLAIVALRGSVPAHWTVDFKTSLGRYCGFSLDQRGQLADIFKELSDTSGKNNRSAGVADVATLGDTWLAAAVQRGLVQPIAAAETYRWYHLLPPRLRQLIRRNTQGLPDPHGAVYGVPYRWGCTLLACRRDRLLRRGGRPVLDWSDLLQPSLEGRVAMLDSPRELLAIALRSLGQSANATAGELAAAGVTEEVLRDRVAAFRRQVKLFSSRDHVRALQAGDVWAVVGYSQDLALLAERSGNIELVAPLSGTQLWADLWTVPSGARGGHRRAAPSPLLPVWFEFTLSPGRIVGLPSLKSGAPMALLPSSVGTLPPEADPHHRRHLLAHTEETASRSPLSTAATAVTNLAHDLPMLRPFLTDPRVGAHSSSKAEAEAGRGDEVGAEAGSDPSLYPAVELHGDNGYLPPAAVLSRSDFVLPMDDETMALYRRVLLEA